LARGDNRLQRVLPLDAFSVAPRLIDEDYNLGFEDRQRTRAGAAHALIRLAVHHVPRRVAFAHWPPPATARICPARLIENRIKRGQKVGGAICVAPGTGGEEPPALGRGRR